MNTIYNTGETAEELKRKYNYDGSSLREAQLRMIEMLSFLDKVCKENNITYFIAFGTLLGAKRHEGFIPWDDDMDVYIDAYDLKKLRKIINTANYKYVVQDNTSDRGFVRYYNVLRDLSSEYIKDEFLHNQRKYRGVQIDLFPYDFGIFKIGKKIINKTIWLNENYLLGKHPNLSQYLFSFTRNIVIPFFRLISRIKGKKYISLGYEGIDFGYTYLASDVFPLNYVNFEGIMVPAPKEIDKILIKDYGVNYNELPNIEQRNQHKVSEIKFW
ncbi:LicD family protein [Actinobacillus equuli]|uniref:LicD family protein n=1 Tax=Actinobacillus equuli TaxID=718 RepID=UPI00244165EB|nr:LicD family protein [Actinobacillus equuli]WGE57047.1 LicD family protein [Actinobacillus equuli subsp. equuli]